MLLMAACDKEDAKPVEPSVPSYEVVSVHYDLQKAEPAENSWGQSVYQNEGSTEIGVTASSGEPVVFDSLFGSGDFPEGDYSACSVPLPKVDAQGRFAGVSAAAIPLTPCEMYRWDVPAPFSEFYPVPSHSSATSCVVDSGYSVTAAFRIELRNTDDGDIFGVEGLWQGRQFQFRRIRVEYDDSRSIEWNHAVNWL